MISKRLMFFAILFISLLAISGVSASEITTSELIDRTDDFTLESINSDDLNNNGDKQEINLEENNNEVLDVVDENVILNEEKKTGSFTDLNDLINNEYADNNTIYLSNNYTFNYRTDGNFINGININRELTIEGNGISINGTFKARIFYVNSSNVIIKNINFINGNSTDYGGAIYWAGNNGTLNNNTFNKNNATNGGAIYWNGKNGMLTNNIFNNNTATTEGGALRINGSNVLVQKCAFNNNLAKHFAGAIYWDTVNGTLDNNTFNKNNAVNGGAIYWDGTNGLIQNNLFNNNHVSNSGGVIFLSSTKGLVQNNTFTNNYAEFSGGAITTSYIGSLTTNGNITINNNKFYNNSATNSGGAISIGMGNSNTKINNNKFYESSAPIGGVIYWAGNNGTLNDNTFKNNNATNGGAIYWAGTNGTLKNNTFNNTNATNGSAIYWTGTYGTLDNNTFNNTNATNGGAIYWAESNGLVENNVFNNNNATNGGAIYWTGTYGTLDNNTFNNNTAITSGGAIYWKGKKGLVKNNVFNNNNAYKGGAICWAESNGLVENNVFNNNNATNGGAFYGGGNNGTISNNTFNNNTATTGGGAIDWTSDKGSVENNVFNNNNATNGGGIICESRNITINRNIFYNNNANQGSASFISYRLSSSTEVNYNIFLNNQGESIYFASAEGVTFNYNWFGNNATNFDYAPISKSEICKTWLFLNATIDSETIPVYSSTNIVYKLYLYNSTFEEVFEYDNTLLPILNLTIYSTKGNINNSANFGDNLQYTATEVGTGSVTVTIENMTYTIELDITKADPNLVATCSDSSYGQNATITLNYDEIATGTVNITLKGDKYNYKFEDFLLKNTITLPTNILPDEYKMTVDYSGDNNFYQSSTNTTIKINLSEININAFDINVVLNGTAKIDSILTPIEVGELTYVSANESIVTVDENGIIKGKSVGQTDIIINFAGNEKYLPSTKTIHVTVNKLGTELTAPAVTATYNVNKYLVITLKDSVGNILPNKKIAVKLGSITKNLTTNARGQISVLISNLVPKTYYATISFAGDSSYIKSAATVKVVVKKATPKLTAKAKIFKRTVKTKKYTITLKNNKGVVMKNTKVTLTVNKKTFSAKTNSKGVATFKITNLKKKGKFTAVVKYAGSKYYNKVTKKPKITIKA